jgi:ABC-type lipopolysaccharide export system ATPase subunit
MAKRRRLWKSILVGRPNKGIHVRVQDSHGIREYLRVQARAYISSKGMVHNIQSKQPQLQAQAPKGKNLIGDDTKRSFRLTRVLL